MAFEGLPDPVYCAGGGYGCPFRTGGGAHLVLPDGTLLRTVLVYLGGAHANPNPGSRPYSTSVVAFASRDGGFHWRYRGVVLDSAGAPESQEGPSENALALLRDGRTVLCVLRLDAGDSKVNRSHYLPYARVTSADGGATWSAPVLLADVHGAPMGAARPRLLRLKGNAIPTRRALVSVTVYAVPGRKADTMAPHVPAKSLTSALLPLPVWGPDQSYSMLVSNSWSAIFCIEPLASVFFIAVRKVFPSWFPSSLVICFALAVHASASTATRMIFCMMCGVKVVGVVRGFRGLCVCRGFTKCEKDIGVPQKRSAR